MPQDVYDVAYDILNARLALSYRALAEGFTIDDVLVELLTTVPAPGTIQWSHPAVPATPSPAHAEPATYANVTPSAPPIVLPDERPAER